IMLCNIAPLRWLERAIPWRHQHRQEKLPSRLAMALESLKLCGVVVLGFLLGLTGLAFLKHATEASEYTLIFLLFLIGIQLRNNGMTLKQIVLNRRGMMVAIVVLGSSLIAGAVNALLLDLPLRAGFAMASGFGWYSLSGILMTEGCRGEGGILVNKNGYRYLQDYGMGPETPLGEPKNKYMELGPRDKVSQAFWHEWRKGNTIST
ncbi:lysine exporter LysO family protein, partial [Salmonella enterica]|uniref:lysine exporter LysO family protein n=1 Tax=Salmonella enterica TaxID=28901 RepID=UPI001CC1E5BF